MYVGNLPFQTTSDELQELFAAYGEVTDIHMPTDRESGRPRGFAFVTMSSKDEMVAAIKGLDGEDHGGRPLRINEAQPREERSGGGGGGGGGSRGGYGGGGGGGGDRRGGGGGGDRRGGGGGGGGDRRGGGGGGGRGGW
jgi:cold-inducible RNA-binding protein